MEYASAAVGFASLAFQTFQGCVQAFDFFYTAQHIGADGDLFRSGLELEKYRLMAWGQKAGIGDGLMPREKLNWQLAWTLLQQLESFMTSAEKLKERYSLDVSEEVVKESEGLQVVNPPHKGIGRFIARLQPDIYTAAGRVIQANNSTIKRLQWAAVGKDKAKRIIGDISDLNFKLEFLLDSADRENRDIEFAKLLRNIVSLVSTNAEAEEIKDLLEPSRSPSEKSIQAAARLKQIRLVIGADKRGDEVQTSPTKEIVNNSMPQLKTLKKRIKPHRDEPLRYCGLELAQYNGSQVLVQWKLAEGVMWKTLEGQTKRLAVLLMGLNDSSFRSLKCVGYRALEEKGLQALIFATPDKRIDWSMKSLYELILEQKHVSLRRRFEISRDLAETVLQLHTAGWMHKSFRSENIIFLSSVPYLVGYEYTRPDTTEAAAFSQLPTTELSADLYRHPEARGLLRETYQKRFDMYALGCVLLELASWHCLIDIQSSYTLQNLREAITDSKKSNSDISMPSLLELPHQNEILDSLRHAVGDSFVDAITLCLLMERTTDTNEASLGSQTAVLEKLELCKG